MLAKSEIAFDVTGEPKTDLGLRVVPRRVLGMTMVK
jgi:hypothetical protein